MKILSDLGWFLITIILCLGVGIILGFDIAGSRIEKDCKIFKAFRVAGRLYDCKSVEKK